MEVKRADSIGISNGNNLIDSIGRMNLRRVAIERIGEMVPEAAPSLDAVQAKSSEGRIS